MARFLGTPNDDGFIGTRANDVMFGEGGDDQVHGYDGNDRIGGEAGIDVLSGNAGSDLLVGGDGDDSIYGGDGSEIGGDGWVDSSRPDGNDRLYGDAGNDSLDGGPGNDRLFGGDGNDFLTDFQGTSNFMAGGAGDDQITGVGRLYGEAGSDGVYGTGLLSGGADNDWVTGAGTSQLSGGTGSDELHAQLALGDGLASTITINDFHQAEGDKIGAYAFTPDGSSVNTGASLFQAFDTNHDGQIRGDGSDAFSTIHNGALELHDWEDTIALKGVDHIDATDWITG